VSALTKPNNMNKELASFILSIDNMNGRRYGVVRISVVTHPKTVLTNCRYLGSSSIQAAVSQLGPGLCVIIKGTG